MRHDGLALGHGALEATEVVALEDATAGRFRDLVDTHYEFIWRSLRRLGVAQGDVDDAAQQVFVTAARKLAAIRPGSERSFLFQTALRVAADSRRTRLRRREVAAGEVPDDDEESDNAPSPEDAVDLRRARMWLDAILDEMSLDLRAVFVLFELDQVTMAEIAALLDLPPGTVASRLRRARCQFREKVAQMAETLKAKGGAA
jgi:RNA polymerase sigma-70 factor (ECF subfamily)